jgi:ESCRT-II complex subunit VPS25
MATAGGGFVAPAIHGFAPLFTLQPADATRAKQLEQWRLLIVAWHQAHRQATMAVREWPLWENKAIGRRLPDDAVAAVMAHVVASGSAEWVDAGRTSCRVFYRSPAEWAARLQAHVEAAAMAATVYTLYELHSGGVLYGTGASRRRQAGRQGGGRAPAGLRAARQRGPTRGARSSSSPQARARLPSHPPRGSHAPPVCALVARASSPASAEFAGMDPVLLLRALEQLESQGLAELFRTPGGPLDEVGVRFKTR